MFLIIYLAALLLAFLAPKSRVVSFVLYLLLVYIFSFSTNHADYMGYLGTYESVNFPSEYTPYFDNFEPLYKWMVLTANHLNFSYQGFLLLTSGTFFLVIYICVMRLSRYPNPVFGCYLIYPFLLDVVQLRNFIGEGFLFLSLYILLKNSKFSEVFSAIFLAMASGFQIIFIYYSSLILLFKRRVNIYIIIGLPIGLITLLLKIGYKIPYLENIVYFQNSSSFLMFFFQTFLYWINFYIVVKIKHNIDNKNNNLCKIFKYGDNLVKFNLIAILSFPLLIFGVDFTRIYRNLNLFNSLYIITAVYSYKNFIFRIYGFIYLSILLVNAYIFYIYIGYDTVFSPILLDR